MSKGTRTLRDIAAEGVLLAGGGRAILLQIAYPQVGHGVAEHSDFAQHPLERLTATMTYVYAVVYGTPTEIDLVRRRVNRAHAPVRRDADETQSGYSAFDPALQLWVVATLYDTAITVYERIFGALDEASAERIYGEYAAIGTALQVPADAWPSDRASFAQYWDTMAPKLAADDATRLVAQKLLHPDAVPLWLRALMPLARLVTAGLLPSTLREDFGLAWGEREERHFARWMRFTAAVYPRLPRRLRHLFRDRIMATLAEDTKASSGEARG